MIHCKQLVWRKCGSLRDVILTSFELNAPWTSISRHILRSYSAPVRRLTLAATELYQICVFQSQKMASKMNRLLFTRGSKLDSILQRRIFITNLHLLKLNGDDQVHTMSSFVPCWNVQQGACCGVILRILHCHYDVIFAFTCADNRSILIRFLLISVKSVGDRNVPKKE